METKLSLKGTRIMKPLPECDEAPPETEPLRVLLISAVGELGGAERSLCELLKALPRRRIEPHVCAPPDSTLARLLEAARVPVHEVPLRSFRRSAHPRVLYGQVRALWRGAGQIAEICRAQGIQLLHANTNSAAFVAWEAARSTGLPFIWHCRDLTRLYVIARILSAGAAAVVAISGAVEQQLLQEGVNPEKIRRIDNGIDLEPFLPSALHAAVRARVRANLGIEVRRPVLLSAGAYVPWKRHELFLETLVSVRRRLPSAVGLLAGSDKFGENDAYVSSLRARARQLSLGEDALKVLSEREDIPELMAAADVFVSCSEHEPFGRVLAEAGAAGLPVVSTRSGGKAEIIEDNVTGILAGQGDVEALAAACTRLLADPGLCRQMGGAARERVKALFDVKRTAGQLAALYESLLKPQAAARV
ncbi:MAG: glycosyltransferase family 4 protein [Planctomycetota bacterium]